MMSTFDRRIRGAIMMLIAFPIALGSFAFGHIVEGLDNPDTQCSHVMFSRPPIPIASHGEGGPNEVGGWSIVPLGITCTYEEPGDGIPPQTVVHANWPATVIWLGANGTFLAGALMALPGLRRDLRRAE